MWLIVATIGYTLLAVVFILDKFIVSKSAVKPVLYTFYSTIFMFGAVLFFPFVGFGWLTGIDWLWALVSGIAFGLGLWTFYLAVKKGETSHISPFNGAMITIFIYLIAFVFLAERLTDIQLAGIAILVFASLLLSFEKSRKYKGFHTGFLWAIISGLFFAVSHVSAKYLYGLYPFWTAFIWTRATTGLVGLFLLSFPSVWRSFKRTLRQAQGKERKPKTYARRHAGLIVVVDKVLGVGAVVLIQYAMAIGSVTLVGAMAGMQYVLMFIFIYLLTKFLPKVFKEYFTRREIAVQLIAILLVALGASLFVL